MVIIDIQEIVKGGAAIVQVPLAVLLNPPPPHHGKIIFKI